MLLQAASLQNLKAVDACKQFSQRGSQSKGHLNRLPGETALGTAHIGRKVRDSLVPFLFIYFLCHQGEWRCKKGSWNSVNQGRRCRRAGADSTGEVEDCGRDTNDKKNTKE